MDNIGEKIISAVSALIIAVLSGLGVGSGGLLVIFLTLLTGMSPEDARGLNLLFFVFSASAAFLVHLYRKRIDLKFVVILSLFAALGTVGGTLFGASITPYTIRKIFGGMLMLAGARTLVTQALAFGEKRGKRHKKI